MAAGSIIGAMAGEQSLDRWAASASAMPFTFACFVDRRPRAVGRAAVLRLLLQGRDPAASTGERGGWHWALYVVGYIGAFLTAIYTFRMIFRAFYGEPVPEARELEARPPAPRRRAHATRRPARWRTPTSASPGPTTTIAERALPMKVAMGVARACGAIVGGLCRSRTSTTCVDNFLRADVRRTRALRDAHAERPAQSSAWSLGTVLGARRASRSPTASGCSGPGTAAAHARARCARAVHAVRQQVVLRRG